MFTRVFIKRAAPVLIATVVALGLPGALSAQAAVNLISNPSVETASGSPAQPEGWQTSKSGTNQTTFTYQNTGYAGTHSLRVQMANRSSGEAKWYFTDVPVAPGQQYKFTDSYNANVQTTLQVRIKYANGSTTTNTLVTLPTSTDWKTGSVTFTAPKKAVSATVMHTIARNGFLETDNFSLTNTSDTTAPVVNITAPVQNAVLTGTTNVLVTATDDAQVLGVQLSVDGTLLGSELTTAPYTYAFNTTTLTNAVHTISAKARDAAGNVTTATTAVTVNNPTSGGGGGSTPAPTIPTFVATPASITAGQTSTLSWTTTDAATLSIDNGVGTVTGTTSTVVTPPTTTTYVLTATNSNSSVTKSVTVTVTPAPPTPAAPTIPTFTATPSTITAGATSTLAWTTTDATTLSIDQGVGTVTGTSKDVTPSATTTYTLTAANTTGSVTKSVTVTVNPATPPTEDNLILNPSLETGTTTPTNWNTGNWGSNTATFTYPVAGTVGARAAKISMTAYTDGDAKWYFDKVAVQPNKDYVFSDSYKSNVDTQLVAEYTATDGTVTYHELVSNLSSSNNAWTTTQHTLTTPLNAAFVTVFHLIRTVGELSVDNFSLTAAATAPTDLFSQGLVSLTFDDGWTTHYDNALPILKAANLKGTFYITSDFVKTNAPYNFVANSSLEAGDSITGPTGWSQGNWGNNVATFTYPATGRNGGRSAQIDISSYTDGDAKWLPNDVPLTANTRYRFTDFYKSTAPTKVTLRFTLTDSTVQYLETATLPAASDWTYADVLFTTPANVQSVTAFHLLSSLGQLNVDDMAISTYNEYLTIPEMFALQAAGQEIGAHTKTHPSLISIPAAQAQDEIAGSKADLIAMGATGGVSNMAYPYGDYNAAVQQMARDAGYTSARSVVAGYNTKTADKFALKVQNVEATTSLATIQSWIDSAAADKTWLILVFHQIENTNPPEFGTSTAILQQLVNYVQTKPVQVKTVGEVLPLLNP